MLLLIKPFLGCNLSCKYCYERHYRKKALPKLDYDLKAIFSRMEEFKNFNMVLHGGEPLMIPKKDIIKIFQKMISLKGESAIQTNGTLIDEDHIEIFKKYKTRVGISFDGPGDLSEFRFNGEKTEKAIDNMVKEKLSVSLIMILSKANAGTEEKFKKFKEYILKAKNMGIHQSRINPCGGANLYELEEKKLISRYLDLADFCIEHDIKWSPFLDILLALKGKIRTCIFMDCDIFHTSSATVVLGDGSVTNCMRTNYQDILLRHPAKTDIRRQILQETPLEFGGCKDCEYWNFCYGGCPTIAINNDWRNRTYHCKLWRTLFKYFKNILKFVDYPIGQEKEADMGINPRCHINSYRV